MLARAESILGRTELLELRLRRARCSPGSAGLRPVDLANILRTSVREMTPFNLPEIRAPAIAEAGTEDVGTGETGRADAVFGDGGAAPGAWPLVNP